MFILHEVIKQPVVRAIEVLQVLRVLHTACKDEFSTKPSISQLMFKKK